MKCSPSAKLVLAGVVTAVLAATAPTPILAGGSDQPVELGFQVGGGLADKDLVSDQNDSDIAPVVGLRGAWNFAENLGWFLDGTYARYDVPGDEKVKDRSFRTGVEWTLPTSSDNLGWFLNGGVGRMNFRVPTSIDDDDVNRTFASIGIGLKELTDSGNFRIEGRADRSLGSSGLGGEDVLNWKLLLGYNWGLGGKPVDTDGDGVFDRKDKCPDTPSGAKVDTKGCPSDGDGDGVWDGLDACPDTPKGWPVDAKGCSLDSDGDGVADGADKCPNTPKGCKVDANGCPVDSDGDGVCDGLDRCPGTAKGIKVDSVGCELDSDGDGVLDSKDKCPGTPAGTKVDENGCAVVLDDDGDGVPNDRDKCPDTPAGTKVNADGCPEGVIDMFQGGKDVFVLEGVNFETDSAKLTRDSVVILDRVVASLAAYSNVNVAVEGHTDSQASDAYNMKLSQRRSESVVKYLVDHGINASRLSAQGFGESKPIADNKTKAGRAKNRRVELRRTN